MERLEIISKDQPSDSRASHHVNSASRRHIEIFNKRVRQTLVGPSRTADRGQEHEEEDEKWVHSIGELRANTLSKATKILDLLASRM